MFRLSLQERKGFQEMLTLRYAGARLSRPTATRRALDAIQDEVNGLSPKVYESGLLLRFDLRLVDLYGEVPSPRRDAAMASR